MCLNSGFFRNLGTIFGGIFVESSSFQRNVCLNSGFSRNLGTIFGGILVETSTFQRKVCPNSYVSHNLGTHSQKFPDEAIENIQISMLCLLLSTLWNEGAKSFAPSFLFQIVLMLSIFYVGSSCGTQMPSFPHG